MSTIKLLCTELWGQEDWGLHCGQRVGRCLDFRVVPPLLLALLASSKFSTMMRSPQLPLPLLFSSQTTGILQEADISPYLEADSGSSVGCGWTAGEGTMTTKYMVSTFATVDCAPNPQEGCTGVNCLLAGKLLGVFLTCLSDQHRSGTH